MDEERGYPVRDDARVARTDARFTERFSRLVDRYGDPFAIPRDKWAALQTWRAEQYAIAHGRDPKTRERVNTPRPKRTPKPKVPSQRTVMDQVKEMLFDG